MNNQFISITEVHKDGRTRQSLLNTSHIVAIKEEQQSGAHNTIIYLKQPRPNHVFVLDLFSAIKEKLNVQG